MKRKHAAHKKRGYQAAAETAERASSTAERNWTQCEGRHLVLLVVLSVITIAIVVCLRESSDEGESGVNSPAIGVAESSEAEEDWEYSCRELMNFAKNILDSRPETEWDDALNYLEWCALQEPENSATRWNLAVALIQMGRNDEALIFISEALRLEPTNVVFLKTGGAFLSRTGHHEEAVECIELYLGQALAVPSWEHLLASLSVQREDEWFFLFDSLGDDVIHVFELLLNSYLQTQSLIKAGYLYKVIIGLKGPRNDPDLLSTYSVFSFGLGDVSAGIKYLRMVTEQQYVSQGYGDTDQAYEVVTAHSLRLLTASFDFHIVSMARNLLLSGDIVWEELQYNCNLNDDRRIGLYDSQTVSQNALRGILRQCLISQGILGTLLDEGAIVYTENIFGWTPLLHMSALGSSELVSVLLSRNADPQHRTVLAHTSLHIAALKGSYDVVQPLLQAGLLASDVDYFNRTALQVACLQRWTAKDMAASLDVPLPAGCPAPLLYSPPLKHGLQGGWLGSGAVLPPELTKEQCSFDVLSSPDVHTFLYEYLALQRPVLIRNATNSHEMKALFQLWQRNKFEQEFGSYEFHKVEEPNVRTLSPFDKNMTTIKDFLALMRSVHQEHKVATNTEDLPYSHYIFEPVAFQSPLLRDFKLPSVLNPTETHISMAKLEVYLGPALSGSTVRFQRSTWNTLLYGQRRWFVYPPDQAFYSKEHVWDWWKETYRENRTAMECVQHPGDLVFVPDMWAHVAINLRESIGLTSEFIYGASEFSI